jgi:hypothetical protein
LTIGEGIEWTLQKEKNVLIALYNQKGFNESFQRQGVTLVDLIAQLEAKYANLPPPPKDQPKEGSPKKSSQVSSPKIRSKVIRRFRA